MICNKIRNWEIYKIQSPSDRIYIGITCRPDNRYSTYRNAKCYKQKSLFNSIKKYGWDSHKFEVIDRFTSNNDYAENKEMFWVRSYMSNKCKYPEQNGLNLTDGGDGKRGFKMSPETIKKISESKKGIPNKAHSERMKGRPNWKKGTIVPQEVRNKISKTLTGRPSPIKGLPSKHTPEGKERIRQYNLGNKYCLGRKATPETKKRLSDSHKGKVMYTKPVIYYTLDKNIKREFNSLKEAATEIGLTTVMVRNYIRNLVKNPKHIFEFKIMP